jgi:hypothetical protein
MDKTGLVILSLLIGLVAGILIGYGLFTDRSTKPVHADPQHYYYRMNDSTVVRHTISVSDSGLSHTVDTLAVEPR